MLGTSKSVWGFNPRTIPGCQLWLDAADSSTITLSGSKVTQWNDKSGNGYNFTQSTSGNQPTYSVSSLNNQNTITFTAANNTYLLGTSSTNFIGTNSLSMYGVFKTNDATSGSSVFAKALYGTASGRILYGYRDPGTPGFIVFANSDGIAHDIPDTYTPGAWRVVGFVSDRSGWTNITYQNGVVTATKTITADTTTNLTNGFPMLVGAYNNSSGGVPPQADRYLDGAVGELIIFNTALTTVQRQQVEGYLAHKWGLAGYTPVTPSSVPGCQLWLDAGDSSTVTGTTTVTEWRDKSGNARHLGVGSGTTSYSSKAIHLANSYMFVTSPVDLTKVTVFIVAKTTGGNNQPVFVGRPNTNVNRDSLEGFGIYMDGTSTIRYYGGEDAVGRNLSFATNTSNPTIFSFQTIGSSVSGKMNKVLQSTGTLLYARTSTAQGFAIGAEWFGVSYGNITTNASLYEIIVFNSDVTIAQRQGIEDYLSMKWFSPSISIEHPYYSLKPHLFAFRPTDVPGCSVWLDGADQSSMTFSDSRITQWRDKSGNARHATPSGLGPVYTSNIFNGYSAPVFASTPMKIPSYLIATDSKLSIFIICKQTGTSGGAGNGEILNITPSWWLFDLFNQTSTGTLEFVYLGGGASFTNYAINNGTNVFVSIITNGLSINGFLNGTSVFDTTLPNNGYSLNNITSQWAISDARFAGPICEILIYNSTFTTTQRQQVEGYLAHKWGLVSPLPAAHSFKSFPPASVFFPYSLITANLIVSLDPMTYVASSTSWQTVGNTWSLGSPATIVPTSTSVALSLNSGHYISDNTGITTGPASTNNFTIEIWFNAPGNSLNNLITETNGGWNTTMMYLDNNTIRAAFWNGNPYSFSMGPYAANTWTQACYTYSGTTVTCYVNGVVTSTDTTVKQFPSVSNYRLATTGYPVYSNAAFILGGFRIYSVALSAAEVRMNYNTYASRFGLNTV